MKYEARSMSEASLPPFQVSGGVLGSQSVVPGIPPMTFPFGFQILREDGTTVAVASDAAFCERLNQLEDFYEAHCRMGTVGLTTDEYLAAGARWHAAKDWLAAQDTARQAAQSALNLRHPGGAEEANENPE